jgi:hypothetical protein
MNIAGTQSIAAKLLQRPGFPTFAMIYSKWPLFGPALQRMQG